MQPRLPTQESAVLALPNFGVLLYLCAAHPLMYMTKFQRVNTRTRGEAKYLGGQPRLISQGGV